MGIYRTKYDIHGHAVNYWRLGLINIQPRVRKIYVTLDGYISKTHRNLEYNPSCFEELELNYSNFTNFSIQEVYAEVKAIPGWSEQDVGGDTYASVFDSELENKLGLLAKPKPSNDQPAIVSEGSNQIQTPESESQNTVEEPVTENNDETNNTESNEVPVNTDESQQEAAKENQQEPINVDASPVIEETQTDTPAGNSIEQEPVATQPSVTPEESAPLATMEQTVKELGNTQPQPTVAEWVESSVTEVTQPVPIVNTVTNPVVKPGLII